MRIQIVLFLSLCLVNVVTCGPFTSIVNLEKLYTLEDELIGIADIILRLERYQHDGQDVHGLEKIERYGVDYMYQRCILLACLRFNN